MLMSSCDPSLLTSLSSIDVTVRLSDARSGKFAAIRESNHGSRVRITRSTMYQKVPFC